MMDNFKLPQRNKYQSTTRNLHNKPLDFYKENLPELMTVNFKDNLYYSHKHDECGFIAFHKQNDDSCCIPKAKIGISLKDIVHLTVYPIILEPPMGIIASRMKP